MEHMKRLFLSMVAVLTAFILQAQETITTSGVQLTDATGQPFIIVGMNNPHAWFGERVSKPLFSFIVVLSYN